MLIIKGVNMKILTLFSCFNRKDKTENCIRALVSGNPNLDFEFVVVNDGSTDGTAEMLQELKKEFLITVLNGENLYYSGGMRLGMQYIKENNLLADYFLIINDDVDFFEKSIENLIEQSVIKNNSVIVGATKDDNENLSYGAIKYIKSIKYKTLSVSESDIPADTFNANCVLIPWNVFMNTPIMDNHYIHSLGDFDYGLSISKKGFKIFTSKCYAGICNNNSILDTWEDRSLSLIQRIKKKESIKGAPFRQWFWFLFKNFGLLKAVLHSITPYLRVLLGK